MQGYVELTVHPLRPDLKQNAGIYQIVINEQWEASFQYNDPTQEICQGDAKQRNLDYYQSSHLAAMTAVDPDSGNGELTIDLPVETGPLINELRPFRMVIEFSLEQPKGGIHFVIPDLEGSMAERGAHMFTCGKENSSRPFETLVDPNMHEVTHFCLPHLMSVLKHTTSYLHQSFEFYEELMSSRYPYGCYKQVFVDESYVDGAAYATMSILSTNLLHSARIIDQTLITRRIMARLIIYTVTGKDVQPFVEQWFFTKRGPLTVTIQELDGSFNHTFKIEENKTKFEITCHSKSRRNKKKKIPLMTGEEVDMDLSAMDADSPVLWLRVDPDMQLLRQVMWEQPDYMWQYQLKFERDVVAQREAIFALEKYPTPNTRLALTDTIENEHCYYKVRTQACTCLAKVANAMVSTWAGPPAMMNMFRKMFGSHSCPTIIRQNNFTNFQHYFILKAMPVAMAQLRDVHGVCIPDVLRFLLDLFKYNDNTKNKFSDNYYRAALVEALANTITPAAATTVSLLTGCLRAIRTFQRFGHLPSEAKIFRQYAQHGVFRDVRLAALDCLVDVIRTESSEEQLDFVLHIVENDPDHYVRYRLLRMLIANPPFKKLDLTPNPLNTEGLVERLWKIMNDRPVQCLYGRIRPSCLPIPESVLVLNIKEKRTKLNPAIHHGLDLEQEVIDKDEGEAGTSQPVSVNLSQEEGEIVESMVEVDFITEPPDLQQETTAEHASAGSAPYAPPVMSTPSLMQQPPVSMMEKLQDSISRLSDESGDEAPPLKHSGSLHTTSAASSGFFTSFSQSSHSLAHLSKDQATSSSTSLTIESSGKSHKAKKKKKKNKHKHKHKHKHERGDRDHHSERRDRDHHSEKREKGRERDRTGMLTSVGGGKGQLGYF
ncbi:hypothetical protein C0Q70_16090 [Pomacea canaliculata]|uniref:Transcription initiation factor TFIID 150 kDa subunit n=1 Tax=Pomacea canaliculata TaxID=400727 RepID=A0A2T7NNU1_POMCA|nr:hypothetical protein C0Q70_16090 [Pomacea canaliculata]